MPVLPGDTRVCHCRHSAVFCQPCQGCLMCLSLVQVCARLGPPASSGNVFFCSGHICLPSAGRGPAQLPAGVPVCHACVTTAPPASVPGSLPPTPPSSPCTGRPPTPLAPCPLPHSVSRETLDFQRQLCHENVFTVGCCLSPRTFWGESCVHGRARGGARSVRVAPPGTTPVTPWCGLCSPIL